MKVYGCRVCGTLLKQNEINTSCPSCGGDVETLLSERECKGQSEQECYRMASVLRERFRQDSNVFYDKKLWSKREDREKMQKEENEIINKFIEEHMITSGEGFEGYSISKYMNEVNVEKTERIYDLNTADTEKIDGQLEKLRTEVQKKLITKSARRGGNAMVRMKFSYITLSKDLISIIGSGIAVYIEKSKK